MPSIIALIPARAGSQRIPGKNIKPLAGHPLIAYTITAAKQSGIFTAILVSTDDDATIDIANACGAASLRRPVALAGNISPDIEWVRHVLSSPILPGSERPDAFAILRPTSPFRTADTIRRAWDFFKTSSYDSIRAVEPVKQHPAKMWLLDTGVYGGRLVPLINERLNGTPMHSCPTQCLPPVYVQNASLEMAWVKTVREQGTISGEKIGPFFTEGAEGFDINTPDDWEKAERMIADGRWTLPAI